MWENIQIAFETFFNSVQSTFLTDLPKLSAAIVVTLFCYLIFTGIRRVIIARWKKSFEDKLVAQFFERFYIITKWVLLAIIFLTVLGKTGVITKIVGAAGISAFIIGFAFKDIGENFLAGIILAFKRPFKLGDIISVNNIEGVIKGIDLREIHLKTFDGKDVYIPNGQLLKTPLFNYTIDGFMRQSTQFHIDYDDDLSLAQRIIREESDKLKDVLQEGKAPSVFVELVEPPTVKITLYYWIDTFTREVPAGEIKSEIIKNVIRRFNENGINTPNSKIEVTTGKQV